MSKRTDYLTLTMWLGMILLAAWATTSRADQWAVSPYRTNETRPLYACDLDCIADQVRGKKIGRVTVGTLCEGQMNPAWTTSGGRQWQFVTNATGERGVAVCSLQIVEPPPPSTCDAGFIPICVAECEWQSGIPATDPACVQPSEPCPYDPPGPSVPIDDPSCVEPPPPDPCEADPTLPECQAPVITDPNHAAYTCAVGERTYTDRTFTWTGLPAPYDGMICLRTTNDDKRSTDPAYVQFTVSAPVTVYLATDSDRSGGPAWLADWTPLGSGIVTTSLGTMWLWARDFPAGVVQIPGNEVGWSTYLPLIGADADIPPPPPPPVTGSASLSWTPPTTDADGGPLTGLSGYEVRYGQGQLNQTRNVPSGAATGVQIDDLPQGTWTFEVRAYDPSANYSPPSNQASKAIP